MPWFLSRQCAVKGQRLEPKPLGSGSASLPTEREVYPPLAAPEATRAAPLQGKLAPAFALLFALATPAAAQITVELPFDPGIPERVVVSKSWSHPAPAPARAQPAPAPPALSAANLKEPQTPTPTPPATALRDVLTTIVPPTIETVPRMTSLPVHHSFSTPPSSLLLSTFAGDSASGAVISTSTWAGNVTQHSGYITIGGTARDDNGWRATGLSLDASGMSYLTITAQRDPGNAAGSLFLQFEDVNLHTRVFSLSTSSFALGTPTQAQIVLGVWSGDFDFTQIVSWSIGGGGVGSNDFRMSLHQVEFGATAIPEPEAYVALAGGAALAAAAVHRRRRRDARVATDS